MTGGRGATRSEALEAATEAFRAVGIADARIDAEALLAGISGIARAELVAFPDQALEPAVSRGFSEAVRRRLRREPVAYVLGRRGFRRIEVSVDPRVLIPRPETEGLVEVALREAPARVLEIGTGSGALALAIADELPDCGVVATDTSTDALDLARVNAHDLDLAGRVRFELGTWPAGGGKFDLVVANLPYVDRERDAGLLEPEVADWEPDEALYGGPGGTGVISAVLSDFPKSGVEAPLLALEVGAGQAAEVTGMVREAGFPEVSIERDLAGIERVVIGRKPDRPD